MSVIVLPSLRPDQLRIARHPAKVKLIVMGRRWGKTVLGGVIIANTIRQHGAAAWVVPEYKNSRPLWRWAQRVFADNPEFRVNKSERTIETARGGFFGVYSADNIDSIRSEAFDVVVVDEGARVSEEAVTDAIIPTLADKDGDLIVPSTPKGKNWFWQWYLQGLERSLEYASWQAPTSANPLPNIRKAFERARDKLSERTFSQEWQAEFLDNGGEVFRNIPACLNAQPSTMMDHPNHRIVMGVDWGKHNDFTVLDVGCLDCRREVEIDRFNKIDYTFQRGRLAALAERWKPNVILAESNAMGEPIIEQLQQDGLPVKGFTTTAQSKPPLIENMALVFERAEWQFLPDAVGQRELEAYERKVSATTGRSSYGAPDGMHDDTVMGRALMLWTGQVQEWQYGPPGSREY